MKKINMLGQKFGRLTVVAPAPGTPRGAQWECSCVCGGTKIATRSQLMRGYIKSCGCLRSDHKKSHTSMYEQGKRP